MIKTKVECHILDKRLEVEKIVQDAVGETPIWGVLSGKRIAFSINRVLTAQEKDKLEDKIYKFMRTRFIAVVTEYEV